MLKGDTLTLWKKPDSESKRKKPEKRIPLNDFRVEFPEPGRFLLTSVPGTGKQQKYLLRIKDTGKSKDVQRQEADGWQTVLKSRCFPIFVVCLLSSFNLTLYLYFDAPHILTVSLFE